jgi:hypothetical protein
MNAYFSSECGNTINRSKYFRGALFRNGVTTKKCYPPNICQSEHWFYGINDNDTKPFDVELTNRILDYKGKFILFQNDDSDRIFHHKIPEIVRYRIHSYARNHIDKAQYENEKLSLINPIIKPMRAHRGKNLNHRKIDVLFYGAMTGAEPPHNPREKAVRLLKNSKLNFVGGLIFRPYYVPPKELIVPEIKQSEHDALLSDSKISLTLWGNNPLSYRLFEGFSRRSLVLAQSLKSLVFLDGGLQAGKHYVEIKEDLSDLEDKIDFYLHSEKEAQEIANNGFEHFKKYYQFSGVDFPQSLYEDSVKSFSPNIELPINHNSLSRFFKSSYLKLLISN